LGGIFSVDGVVIHEDSFPINVALIVRVVEDEVVMLGDFGLKAKKFGFVVAEDHVDLAFESSQDVNTRRGDQITGKEEVLGASLIGMVDGGLELGFVVVGVGEDGDEHGNRIKLLVYQCYW